MTRRFPCQRGSREEGVPPVELRYFDGGQFVLDEFADAIAEAISGTFSR
jgi:hypothetical protein